MELAQSFISNSWRFMTGVPVPVFGFSFGALLMGVFALSIFLKVMKMLFGLGASGLKGIVYKSGRGGRAKVSDERRNDER